MQGKSIYKLAFSIGDPNGIGIEIIFKALENFKYDNKIIPIIFGSTKVIHKHLEQLNKNFKLNVITKEVDAKPKFINILDGNYKNFQIDFGKSNIESGEMAFKSLEYAAKSVKDNKCDALITAPINKDNIQSRDFKFPGHTEYLENLWGGKSLMFMVEDNLKVGLVTNHLPIMHVAKNITKENILNKLNLIINSLKGDFGIIKPKIAILSLNPHAGDNGLLGSEEKDIIIPAIKQSIKAKNIVLGPFPADSFFSQENINKFDAVLAMYHDQGLIPFKSLAGLAGVNFTAGLPYVRTSPDHGVAYDIAGKNCADPLSMISAIEKAVEILNNRQLIDK